MIAQKTLIERVWQIAQKVKQPHRAFIATDCIQIKMHAEELGAQTILTKECASGTDRVYEVAKLYCQPNDLVLILQGDAVLTPPWILDALITACHADPGIQISTPMIKLNPKQAQQFIEHKRTYPSAGTTVVFDKHYNALYFSKAILPFSRTNQTPIYRHIGVYAYRFQTLKQFVHLPKSPLELTEGLEQLRALTENLPIKMISVDYRGRTHGSIDYPEDIPIIEAIIAKEGELL